jgi:hypothetical protein
MYVPVIICGITSDTLPAPRPMSAYQLSSAKSTLGRIRYDDPLVKRLLVQMDFEQLFHVADGGTRIGMSNVRKYVKEKVDDVLAEESTIAFSLLLTVDSFLFLFSTRSRH